MVLLYDKWFSVILGRWNNTSNRQTQTKPTGICGEKCLGAQNTDLNDPLRSEHGS